MTFEELDLLPEILETLKEKGYETPTPIQAKAIPAILGGDDIMGAAQTGTGKTAGFTLPMLQKLAKKATGSKRKHVLSLVLTPTRELAAQVQESIRTYGKKLPLKTAVIYGGVNMKRQVETLRRGVDIIVATPGRLLDHLNQSNLDLSHIKMLILDEADRILDMGFIHDVKKIIEFIPKEKQTLLFSATFSPEIKKLARTLLRNPTTIEVASENSAAKSIKQIVHPVDRERKSDLLYEMIIDNNWQQVLVFTRTKHSANRLSMRLDKDGISSDAIHGNKSQGARTKSLADFKRGKTRILVATDIAARGLDIEQLPHVINFELPTVAEDYVHRIGRTGRAGSEGEAISLVCIDEQKLLRDIERFMKGPIEKKVIEGFEPNASIKAQPIRQRHSHKNQKSPSNSRKSFGDKRRSPSDKKSYGDKKRFGDKKRSSSEKKSYGAKKRFGDKPRSSSEGKSFGDKKRFSDKPRASSGKSYGDKKRSFGAKKSYNSEGRSGSEGKKSNSSSSGKFPPSNRAKKYASKGPIREGRAKPAKAFGKKKPSGSKFGSKGPAKKRSFNPSFKSKASFKRRSK